MQESSQIGSLDDGMHRRAGDTTLGTELGCAFDFSEGGLPLRVCILQGWAALEVPGSQFLAWIFTSPPGAARSLLAVQFPPLAL